MPSINHRVTGGYTTSELNVNKMISLPIHILDWGHLLFPTSDRFLLEGICAPVKSPCNSRDLIHLVYAREWAFHGTLTPIWETGPNPALATQAAK